MKPSPSSGDMSDPEVEFITLEGDHRCIHAGRHKAAGSRACLDLTGYYKFYTAHSPAMRSSRQSRQRVGTVSFGGSSDCATSGLIASHLAYIGPSVCVTNQRHSRISRARL